MTNLKRRFPDDSDLAAGQQLGAELSMARHAEQQTTFRDSVCLATASLMLSGGVQAVKSADIVRECGTTESRLFRHFDGMKDVMHATFEWAWRRVVDAVTAGSFASVEFEPRAALGVDLQSILEMRDGEESLKAAVVAFMYYRRPEEMAACGHVPVESQVHYRRRLTAQCRALLQVYEPEILDRCCSADEALASRLLNYMATAFLNWYLIPRSSVDPLDELHEQSVDEVLLGANQLIDRFFQFAKRTSDSDQSASTSSA